MLDPSIYKDSFAREHLPPEPLWPELPGNRPEFLYPKKLNAAVELLDSMIDRGFGNRPCIRSPSGQVWSYEDLRNQANRLAATLVNDCGLQPGNRVLLRAVNSPMLAAAWFAVLKAGGIVVTTMPLLRSRELAYIIAKARIGLAICDKALGEELEIARTQAQDLRTIAYFNTPDATGLEARMASRADRFENVIPSHDDVALIAFTSGTTGKAKATVHFHRDVLTICDGYARSVVKPQPEDIFSGTPPLAFTFGLGGLLLFPLRFGASTLLLERATAASMLQAIQDHRVTSLFTAPTMYRAMTGLANTFDLRSLKRCVSAGEHLPATVLENWRKATGITILDGIGSTEMLHIFVTARDGDARPGSTGRPVDGYQALIVDEEMRPLPANTIGRLAVKGPTGCRYLDDDERQKDYVRNGWNLTGDAYRRDEDGYFWYQARTDDMIVSAGYNISGTEVESVMLDHPAIKELAVVGVADDSRGMIVKAFVVLKDPRAAGEVLAKELQDFVKAQIAPYKYPRAIEFIDVLPRTETGKVQRFRLRERDKASRS
jgi:2-aminobenzoate-CoA ligase